MSNMSKLILFFIYLFLKDKIISVYSDNSFKNDIPRNIYLINLFIRNNSNFFIFYDKKNKPKLKYKEYV